MPNSVGMGRDADLGSGEGPWKGCHCGESVFSPTLHAHLAQADAQACADGLNPRVRLKAITFLDDCPPGCGGFTLWP